MKLIKIIAVVLSLVVVVEFIILNKIQGTGEKKPSQPKPSPIALSKAPTSVPAPTVYQSQVQNWFIRDIKQYMKSKDTPAKKMVNVMLYTGWIDSVSYDADKVTIVTINEAGQKIEKYLNWSAESFMVYEKRRDDLIKKSLKDLHPKTKVVVKEYEEVVRDTMDPKHILSYVEIVIQN